MFKRWLIFSSALVLAACGDDPETVEGRWYSAEQVRQGEALFARHCARCHGEKAQGTAPDWRRPMADGRYPPPPLNGTAHTWHHPLSMLRDTVRNGGAPVGGWMPAFGSTLSDEEIDAVLAYVQSLWPDEIYRAWLGRGGLD